MTLQREGAGTGFYTPPSFSASQDVAGLVNPPTIAPSQSPIGPARFTADPIGKDYPGLYYCTWTPYDLRGAQMQQGRVDVAHASWSETDYDQRYIYHAVHSQLTTGETLNLDTGTVWNMASENVFNKLAIAFSSTTQTYLYTETSATNPALTQLTFALGASHEIVALHKVVANNYTTLLAVCQAAAPVRLLSDLGSTPTAVGNMDNATAACYGMIQTFLPDLPILMHCGTNILSMPASAAYNAASPTLLTVLPNVPSGGYALGLAKLKGDTGVMAYWVWPKTIQSAIHPAMNSNDPTVFDGHIMRTNQYGTLPEELTLPLRTVTWAVYLRLHNVIAASDTYRVVLHDGADYEDTHIFGDAYPNSDRQYRVMGLYVKDESDLYAEINEIASASGTGNTRRRVMQYDFDLKCWRPASAWQTIPTTGLQSYMSGGSLPVSKLTGNLHAHTMNNSASGKHYYQFQPPTGTNPYTLRKTSGAQSGTGAQFEASATLTLPEITLPYPLEGALLSVARVIGPPEKSIKAGGTNATVTITVGGKAFHFNALERSNRTPQSDKLANSNWVHSLQPVITSTQQSGGTDPTRFTPQILPFTIEFWAYRAPPTEPPAGWRGARR